MKKIVSILILIVTLVSCEEEVSFNNPSFEGYKDNVLWRAKDYNATYNPADSTLVLNGYRGLELVTLTAYPVLAIGDGTNFLFENATFVLGDDDITTASYQYAENGVNQYFETGEDLGVGELVVENVVNQMPGTISGRFRFDAPKRGDTSDFPETVNFQYGVFYQIPITISAPITVPPVPAP